MAPSGLVDSKGAEPNMLICPMSPVMGPTSFATQSRGRCLSRAQKADGSRGGGMSCLSVVCEDTGVR